MLRFGRPRQRTTNHGTPRLSRLVVLLGLSLVAIGMLRWQSRPGSGPGRSDAASRSNRTVENALEPPLIAGLADGVVIAGWPAAQSAEPPEPATVNGPPSAQDDSLPVVDQRLLASVLDKSKRLSPRAYYHLVDLATRTSPEILERHAKSEREITLAHLATEPDKHRGELIYLTGRLRGLVRFEATQDSTLNPSGLKHLYQGDLFTPQAHPYPYVLIMPSVPEGIPQGMDLLENVTFVGYFLQLWRYAAPGRVDRVAPVLIGRMLTWTPAPKVEPTSPLGVYLAVAILLSIVGLGTSVWAMNRRPARKLRMGGGMPLAESNLDAVKDQLAELERNQRPAGKPETG